MERKRNNQEISVVFNGLNQLLQLFLPEWKGKVNFISKRHRFVILIGTTAEDPDSSMWGKMMVPYVQILFDNGTNSTKLERSDSPFILRVWINVSQLGQCVKVKQTFHIIFLPNSVPILTIL
ncbi:hypothetical protein CsSME_00006613 [Camellia sinensis var. sinensis]